MLEGLFTGLGWEQRSCFVVMCMQVIDLLLDVIVGLYLRLFQNVDYEATSPLTFVSSTFAHYLNLFI